VIHIDLHRAAHALSRTAEVNPDCISELVTLLSVSLVLAQREMLMHLWRAEEMP